MRRNYFYRAYAKELINYLNLIILINYLIQVDRQSESAILWITLEYKYREKSPPPPTTPKKKNTRGSLPRRGFCFATTGSCPEC